MNAYSVFRDDLLAYAQFVQPGYEISEHHKKIAKALQAAERGEIKRLIISCPPQRGKTALASILFPSWAYGRNPNRRIILSGYTAEVAERYSRGARDSVNTDRYRAVFDHVLDPSVQNIAFWRFKDSPGYVRAVGVGGAATSFGADFFIIDDPIKDQAEAMSETIRQTVWDWYQSVVLTRLSPGATVAVIQCMTGDTPVLMADGTEKPLRHVQVGDRVATWRDGALSVSTVRNHRSNGYDSCFRITTNSGRIVTANERHPFLVQTDGGLKWIRLKQLQIGQRIVSIASGIEGFGQGRPAPKKGVISPCDAEVGATSITQKRGGRRASGLHHRRSILRNESAQNSSIGTASRSLTIGGFSKVKVAYARYVKRLLRNRETPPIGTLCSASIIATTPAKFEVSCATIATSSSSAASPSKPWSELSFTSDPIVAIDPVGQREVFDLQVDETENFIANGLVSHNTRWHLDDLVGRLLADQPDNWTVVNIPAVSDEGVVWPERWTREDYDRIKAEVGSRVWNALYQGQPVDDEGGLFKRAWLGNSPTAPQDLRWIRAWDLATSEKTSADYTVGALMAVDATKTLWIKDVVRGQWEWPEARRRIIQTANTDGHEVSVYVEQGAFKGGALCQDLLDSWERIEIPLYARKPVGDKVQRANPVAARAESGRVRLVEGPWNKDFVDEFASFPLGKHDDIVDAVSLGFSSLVNEPMGILSEMLPPRPGTYAYFKALAGEDIYDEDEDTEEMDPRATFSGISAG